jgi:type IV secretory pathway VirB10-like protein
MNTMRDEIRIDCGRDLVSGQFDAHTGAIFGRAATISYFHFSLHYSVPQGVDRGGAVNITGTQIAKRDGNPAKHFLDESSQVVDLKAERAWRNW